ncbi:MAG: precorrin-3B C(17)-methyltransferase [Proteobacteria bacterium]|nr:precorrin-3B C(17)-methyltransferase [Pseudomonadota bacterium]
MSREDKDKESNGGAGKGSIYVIGIGPGGPEHLTALALKRLSEADAVVGYKRYVELVSPFIEGKEIHSRGMMQEVERCKIALELAATGRRVAVVSSGDSGIYGMAGLVLELVFAGEKETRPEVEIIAGVPAFVAAAALLGAPLMHDFASISLSDLLTPWESIERRVEAAASADFVIALYNPKSKKRITGLQRALDIVSKYRSDDTPVGIVRNATREGESVVLTTLGTLSEHYDSIDMLTLLLIGSSTTRAKDGLMVTPRGYRGV